MKKMILYILWFLFILLGVAGFNLFCPEADYFPGGLILFVSGMISYDCFREANKID